MNETDPLVCWVSWLSWGWVGVICNRLPLYIWTLPSYNPTSPQVERGNAEREKTHSDYQMTQKQIDSYFCSRGCKIIPHLFCSKRTLWWRGPTLEAVRFFVKSDIVRLGLLPLFVKSPSSNVRPFSANSTPSTVTMSYLLWRILLKSKSYWYSCHFDVLSLVTEEDIFRRGWQWDSLCCVWKC